LRRLLELRLLVRLRFRLLPVILLVSSAIGLLLCWFGFDGYLSLCKSYKNEIQMSGLRKCCWWAH
jgi:cell division protein FtsB